VYGDQTFTFTAQDAFGNLSAAITVTIHIRPRLDPGDIIVADQNFLYHYDPATSQNIILSQDQGMSDAINVAYKKNVGLFVYDKATGIIAVDPYTGTQSLVAPASGFSSAGPIGGPPGMLVNNSN